MAYWIWIPFVVLLYFFQAFLTYKNNLCGGKWFWIFLFVGALNVWPIISRFSKSVVFDSLLFNSVLFSTYFLGLIYFGAEKLRGIQLVGMLAVGTGLILLRWK